MWHYVGIGAGQQQDAASHLRLDRRTAERAAGWWPGLGQAMIMDVRRGRGPSGADLPSGRKSMSVTARAIAAPAFRTGARSMVRSSTATGCTRARSARSTAVRRGSTSAFFSPALPDLISAFPTRRMRRPAITITARMTSRPSPTSRHLRSGFVSTAPTALPRSPAMAGASTERSAHGGDRPHRQPEYGAIDAGLVQGPMPGRRLGPRRQLRLYLRRRQYLEAQSPLVMVRGLRFRRPTPRTSPPAPAAGSCRN